MIKCIPNKFYRTELFSYSEYYKSHDWELQVEHTEWGREQTWVCADCDGMRITPTGTIDFTFGCSLATRMKEDDIIEEIRKESMRGFKEADKGE